MLNPKDEAYQHTGRNANAISQKRKREKGQINPANYCPCQRPNDPDFGRMQGVAGHAFNYNNP